MKRKLMSILLVLCMAVSILPMAAFADTGGEVRELTKDTELGKVYALQNDYIRVAFYNTVYSPCLATIPTAIAGDIDKFPQDVQAPYCNFITWRRGVPKEHTAWLTVKNIGFTDSILNGGTNRALKIDYDASIRLYDVENVKDGTEFRATVSAYHELVRVTENPDEQSSTWGVLTTVTPVKIDMSTFPQNFDTDSYFTFKYYMSNFTGMGHGDVANSPGGTAIKMHRTTVTEDGEQSTQSSVVTSRIEGINTVHYPRGYKQWGDLDGEFITEVYTDGYQWANPFVGLSEYYETNALIYGGDAQPLQVRLPQTVTASPNDFPVLSWVISESHISSLHEETSAVSPGDCANFLWGYHDLVQFEEELPTNPDEISSSFSASRLAAFKTGSGITVEYAADDAALEVLKKKYNASPVAQISGEYKSVNGSEFEFTDGAARLTPTVTATWNKSAGGKLIIRKDGTIEQYGVNLNAPSFKFYQPKQGAEESLKINLNEGGFEFETAPEDNSALIYVDIPYAVTKLEKATADVSGNLVFHGKIGFKTIFDGAEFSLEKLGYGLKEKDLGGGKKDYEFKVNGVKASGSFNTADLFTLELAEVEGEVNTFKGEERYAFSLKLNAFDLFETEASLALERGNNGTLLPDELWFYVKASPGIVLIPPVPIGQLNGGGAGFKDLAATVNGNYFAIPPIKLRGALTGTYLHLIEGTGNIVIGPSEISLMATDVNLVGAGKATQIVDKFGYSLKLNGQERNYKGDTYEGLYFGGSKEIALNLPTKQLDIIDVDAILELGAFGGLNSGKDNLYLAIGANGTVQGTLKTPIFGINLHKATVNLIVGGQTVIPIRGVSVEEGFKKAFNNIDMYLGAMAESRGRVFGARAWVLIPRMVQTKFKKGEGWDVEIKLSKKLGNWDWESKGVTPVVSAVPQLLSLVNSPMSEADINVTVDSPDETPYILLSFDNTVTEEEIKSALAIDGKTIHWAENGELDPASEINAITDTMTNKKDGKEYRVVLLNLRNGGDYHISANGLTFEYEQANETPYERLNLALSGNTVTGKVDYANSDEKYVIRTYLAKENGGADYLVDERELENPSDINVQIPQSGALVPTGEYYVTSFLMVERASDINEDGIDEQVLLAIDNNPLDGKVGYINVNEPTAPQSAVLTSIGNEVMHAQWDGTTEADGYSVTIYCEDDERKWIDTGFGYNLDKDTTSIDMALTVGENPAENEENKKNEVKLSADKNYKIGVKAYKMSDDVKYFSAETQSQSAYLPKYTPLDFTLMLNGDACEKDDKIYNAYIGSGENRISVSCTNANAAFKMYRMDTNDEIQPDENGEYVLSEFEGTLMFRIDGILGNDVTSEYLLVSRDGEPPVLSLSADMFIADKTTGEYKISGSADAGSKIWYDENASVNAESDGSFEISGTLEEGDNSVIITLCAKDAAGNMSMPKYALIARRTGNSVTVNGSYAQNPGSGDYNEGETVNINAGTRDGYSFAGWSGNVTFADSKNAETTFIMPNEAVTVTANWSANSSHGGGGGSTTSYYTVTFETNGGSEISAVRAEKNKSISEPAAPVKEGYVFSGWYSDKGLKTKYDFSSKITKNITLYAAWTEKTEEPSENEWKNPFTDVKENDWFFGNVKYSVENGLILGTSDTTFEPQSLLTRAMLVTILWRAEGKPQTDYLMPFKDVAEDSYYAEAVRWAASEGIVSGMTETEFAPNDSISREQIAAIIYRYAKYKDIAPEGAWAIRLDYADTADISDYAAEGVMYCKLKGIMQGKNDNKFAPKDSTTRAEAAAVLERFLELE